MRPSSNVLRGLALAAALAALAGCSEYFERQNNVSLVGGNAVNGDRVVQIVDPWPRASANRDIAYDGNKMETAADRYRTGRVIQPRGIGTSGTYDAAPAPQQPNNSTPVGPTVTSPAAPVK
jgi:hypothetical protein